MLRTRSTLMVVALLAGASAASLPAQQSGTRSRVQTRVDTTFAFSARGTIVLSVGQGDVTVQGWDQPTLRVRGSADRGLRLDASAEHTSLSVLRNSDNGHFDVMVPRGVRVDVRATTGEVAVRGTRGIVEARTQSGDLLVEDASDIVDLRTYSGDLTARTLAGNIELNTLSGDVLLAGARGDVEVTTVSGEIELTGVASRYVRARSTSGEINFEGILDPTGRYELASHSGGVTVALPRNTGALLSVATYSGAIESDFPITLKPGEHGLGSAKRFTFEIGRAEARVSAESFSGDIIIRARGADTPNQ